MNIMNSGRTLSRHIFSLTIALFLCGCLHSGPLVGGKFALTRGLLGDWRIVADGKASLITVTKLPMKENVYGISEMGGKKPAYTAVFLTPKLISGYLMVITIKDNHVYAVVQPDQPAGWHVSVLTLRKDGTFLADAAVRARYHGLYIKQGGLGDFELGGDLNSSNVSELFEDPSFIGATVSANRGYFISRPTGDDLLTGMMGDQPTLDDVLFGRSK